MSYRLGPVMVGDVLLPDLPAGYPVSFDCEASGLRVDGDPGGDSGDAGSPPARVSAASVAWRDPVTGKTVKHAWGFDQGPCPGKWGRVRRPREGGGHEDLDVDKYLLGLAKAGWNKGSVPRISAKTGKELKTRDPIPYTWQECYEAIGWHHWVNLLKWLRERTVIVNQNLKYDMHIASAGPRRELFRQAYADSHEFRRALGLAACERADHELTFADEQTDLGWIAGCNLDYLSDRSLRPVDGFWDTMLVQAFFDPLHSVALKPTGKRLLRVDADAAQKGLKLALSKQGTGLTNRYDLVPWFIMEQYAADDAELALDLYYYQLDQIELGDCPPHTPEQIAKEMELMRVLYRMERRGVGYDVERSLAGADDLKRRMAEIEEKLTPVFDPRKLDEVRAFYFGPESEGGLGILPLKVTEKTNTPSIDEAQIRLFVQDGQPWAAEYDEWSHCKSAVGKWYEGWARKAGPDGRLRTDFKQCAQEAEKGGGRPGGAISGRLAVGGVQLHAIPHNGQLPEQVKDKPVRQLIQAKPGYALWETDLPQGEVRIATVIVNCEAMWDVVDSGEDLHGSNAKRIFKIDEDDPTYADLRGVAKRIVFGTLYGAGVTTLKKQILEYTGLDYSEADTREARDAFNRTFPEFKRVADRIQRKADRNLGGLGYVNLIDGRRRWFSPDEFTHKAFNAVIQGSLAQTGKTWMIEVERQLPGIQLLAIHDSIVVEVPDNEQGAQMARDVAAIGKAVYEKDYGVRGRKMSFDIVPERWEKKAGKVLTAA